MMLPAYNAAGGAAAAHAAMVNAIKAVGTIIRVEPQEFTKLLGKSEQPLVVHGIGGFWKKKHQYLTNYRGLNFYTESIDPLSLTYKSEIIEAKTIWVPNM
jgi:hypothetical protein